MTFPKCAHTFKINKKQSARRMLFGRAPAGEHNDYATNYLRRAEEQLVDFQNRFEILTQITPDYSEQELTNEERNQVFQHPQQNNNMSVSDNNNQFESNSNEKDEDSSNGIDASLSVSSSVVCCLNNNDNNNNNNLNNNNDNNINITTINNNNNNNNHNMRDIKINVSTSCNNKCNTKATKQTDITDYFTIRVNLRPIQNKKDQRNSCNKEEDTLQSEDIEDDSDING